MSEVVTDPVAATVFFTADGDVEAGLRRLVHDWRASGLVDDTVWVSAAAWRKIRPDLHELEADLLSRPGRRTDRVLSILGGIRFEVLRVVLVQIIPADGGGDPELADLGEALLGRLRQHLPAGTPLRAVNLIVPATGVEGIPAAVLLETPHASLVNVVASPEDRISDSRINEGVRAGPDGNLEGHAALAAVTAAGAWTGMSPAPFDERAHPSLAGEHVVVSRSFVAAAQIEPIIDTVSGQALRPRTDWPLPDSGSRSPSIPALDPTRVTDRILEQCGDLDDKAFRYRPYPAPPPPQPRTIGIWAAFLEMFRFIWRGLMRLPSEVAEGLRTAAVQRAEQLGQRLTYGEASSLVVRLRGRALTDTGLSVAPLLSDANRVLEVAGLLGETYAPPNPELWKTLRSLAFGLIDGSDLPAPFENPTAGDRRQIITQARLVTPDPYDPDAPDIAAAIARDLGVGSVELPACDPYAAELARAGLEQRLAAIAADGDAPAEQRALETEHLERTRTRLAGWVARQSAALLWRLAERVAAELGSARADLAEALEQLPAGPPGPGPAERIAAAWKRCRRRWILTAVLAAAAVALTWQADLSTANSSMIIGAVALAATAVFVSGYVSYRRVVFQELHRIEAGHFALTVAYEQAVQAAREIVRLGSLYTQLADWGEIMGAVTHRPWGVPGSSPDEHRLPADPALPRALNLATGQTSDEQRAALAAGAARHVFTHGWATDAYVRFADTALARLAVQEALNAPPDPDVDTPQATNGARRHLRRELGGERYTAEAFAEGRRRVLAYLRDRTPEQLVTAVRPVRPGPDGQLDFTEPLTTEQFFARIRPDEDGFLLGEIWTDKALASTLHRVERCRIWAPEGTVPAARRATDGRWDLRETELPGGGLSVKAIRVDASPPCTSRELRIFAQPADPEQPTQFEEGV